MVQWPAAAGEAGGIAPKRQGDDAAGERFRGRANSASAGPDAIGCKTCSALLAAPVVREPRKPHFFGRPGVLPHSYLSVTPVPGRAPYAATHAGDTRTTKSWKGRPMFRPRPTLRRGERTAAATPCHLETLEGRTYFAINAFFVSGRLSVFG